MKLENYNYLVVQVFKNVLQQWFQNVHHMVQCCVRTSKVFCALSKKQMQPKC